MIEPAPRIAGYLLEIGTRDTQAEGTDPLRSSIPYRRLAAG